MVFRNPINNPADCAFDRRDTLVAVQQRMGLRSAEYPVARGTDFVAFGQDLARENHHVISTINGVIETCKGCEMGFRTCAENVEDSEIKGMLTEWARHCAESASELQAIVGRFGGRPDTHGSLLGTLHRAWLNFKSAITGKDEVAAMAECERNEDIAVRRYKDALAQDLPGNIRSVIERQYQGVLAHAVNSWVVWRTSRPTAA